jgi:two-component system NtrC family sensor kinase
MEESHPLKHKYYRALSRNIISVILIASISPMVIASIFILDNFRTAYRQKVYDQLEQTMKNHRKCIDFFLKEKLANIRLLGNQFNYEQFSHKPFLEQKLAQLQQSYDRVFVDLGMISERGIQVSYAGPHALTNADYSQADWFKKAMATPYFTSDVFYGLRGAPHFIVSVRCFGNGHYWLLRATIDFGSFNSIVENFRIGRTGFAFIINKSGEFQTKPIAATDLPANILRLFGPQSYGRSSSVVSRMDATGKQVIHASIHLKDHEWILVLQQDQKDAFAELYKTQKIAMFIILTGSLVIISTSLLLSRGLIKRIAQADQEKKLADKEKEMMSQQVIETGKLASIGELAAGIAHEINNPVAIMVEEAGWIEDLLEEEEFRDGENLEEFHRALRQIHTQGRRCKDITHKLLSFARKTDSRVHEVQINELLDEVVALSSQRAKYSNIAIRTHFQKNLPVLHASETELQQVLLNIMNNALDATEKSGGEISISSQLKDEKVVITFADNGPGIAEANLPRIFDPFFTTKPVGKGTGLGLSICYGIINKMGGRIDVQSQINRGTTFMIQLPITEERQGMPTEANEQSKTTQLTIRP